MKRSSPALIALLALLLPGCLATQSGRLEVLNPKQAYGRSIAVLDNLHDENEAIEKRLASDLQNALAKRGLTVAEDPSKAEIVIVPTLGRMRERTPVPAIPPAEAAPAEDSPAAETEPVVAAPAPEARPFRRLSSAAAITRPDLVSRRQVPSARTPSGAQQAGLLLTGYRGEDFRDYGLGRQSLPPVWRIYVSQPAVQMKWKSVALPLINAAAGAAAPLGKSAERGAEPKLGETAQRQSTEQREKKEEQPESREKKKSEKPAAEQPESRVAGSESREKEKKKGSVFRFFGVSEDPEKKPE